jgi:murein DD-endopeptidase MepM/ murein hydrolase activator NlpD
MIGVGLLLPSLFLTHPAAAADESKPSKASQKKSVSKEPVAASRKSSPSARADDAGPRVHLVRAGDTLSRIASRHRVSQRALIEANALARPDRLRQGQRLVIPEPGQTHRQAVIASPRSDGTLVAAVGPRRVPTRLFLSVPELNGRAIDFLWPVDGPVISGFGRRRGGWHAGIDIKAQMGTPILAAAPGTGAVSGWERFYGRVLKIEHESGFFTIYAHTLQNVVKVGDRVEAGMVVGTVGRTGRSTGYHLHFEIRQDGVAYNPLYLLHGREVARVPADEPTEPVDEDEPHE